MPTPAAAAPAGRHAIHPHQRILLSPLQFLFALARQLLTSWVRELSAGKCARGLRACPRGSHLENSCCQLASSVDGAKSRTHAFLPLATYFT